MGTTKTSRRRSAAAAAAASSVVSGMMMILKEEKEVGAGSNEEKEGRPERGGEAGRMDNNGMNMKWRMGEEKKPREELGGTAAVTSPARWASAAIMPLPGKRSPGGRPNVSAFAPLDIERVGSFLDAEHPVDVDSMYLRTSSANIESKRTGRMESKCDRPHNGVRDKFLLTLRLRTCRNINEKKQRLTKFTKT
ncbi:hypothetical protein GPALN_012596 [Globodera pallida]|nr:hypothetical protein GPALN_012596 [Globodera pallida]